MDINVRTYVRMHVYIRMYTQWRTHPRQSLTVNIHCEFSSRFHSDSKRIRSGFESKRRESPRIHNVFAQQYGFANFGRVFTVIRCETLSWVGFAGRVLLGGFVRRDAPNRVKISRNSNIAFN